MRKGKKACPVFEQDQPVSIKRTVVRFATALNGLADDVVLYHPGDRGKIVSRNGDSYVVRMDNPVQITSIQFHATSLEPI
jgi:hypothetical protein